jgi:hypothetical protein
MRTKVLYIVLVLLVVTNLGWVALNIHSDPYIPVPKDMTKVESGQIFVNVTWRNGGGNIWVPMLSGVLALVGIAVASLPGKTNSKSSGPRLD